MYLELADNAPLLSRRRRKKDGGTRHPIKAVMLAPGRALFLLMLDENIDGLASRLATENISGLSKQWEKMGGDQRKLVQMINKGKGKKARRFGFLSKFTGAQHLGEDEENPANLSNDQKAKIIAASTALGAAIGATIPAAAPVAIPGGPILGSVIVGVIPFIKNAANKTQSAEDAGANLPTIPEPPASILPGEDGEATAPGSWMGKKNFTGFTNGQTALGLVNIAGIAAGAVMIRKKKKAAGLAVLGLVVAADAAYYFTSKNNQ